MMKTLQFFIIIIAIVADVVDGQTPTPPPTKQPTNKPTFTNEWYYQWSTPPKCVKDCPTTDGADCGGIIPGTYVETYTTLESCCTTKLSNYVTEYCIANSQSATNDYAGTNQWYMSSSTYSDLKCVQDCAVTGSGANEVCGGIIISAQEAELELYSDVTTCCDNSLSNNVDWCVGNSDPTSTGTNLYYADGSSCVKDADTCSSSERCGRATIDKTLHPDIVTCCSESLSWVKDEYCQTRSIGTYVEKWFVTSGKCSKDCDPTTTGEPCADVPNTSTSMEFFVTVEECCSTKLTYLDAEECKVLSEGSSTTTGSTTPYLGTSKYYVDSQNNRCVQDCSQSESPTSGDGVCGGIVAVGNYPPLHDTPAECCDAHLSYIDPAFCLDNSKATSTGTGLYFSDYAGYCVKDTDDASCASPEKCKRATASDKPLFDSVQSCCSTAHQSNNQELCTTRSVGTYTNMWFASFLCMEDCDPLNSGGSLACGDVPSMSVELYPDVAGCCNAKLSYFEGGLTECVAQSESGGTATATGSNEWYIGNNYENRCVKDCFPEDDPDCGGLIEWGDTYVTLGECCEKLSNVALGLCEANSDSSVGPFTGTEKYYQDQTNHKCVQDCAVGGGNEACGGIIETSGTLLYETVDDCCQSLTWVNDDFCKSNSDPASLGSNMYYPGTSNCIKDTDTCPGTEVCGRASLNDMLYGTLAECCASQSWNNQELCESRSLGTYTDKWFASFVCSKDCDPNTDSPCKEVPNLGVDLYDTVELCCSSMPYLDAEECKASSENSGGTTTGSTTPYEGTSRYYVDYSGNRCVQDCLETASPTSGDGVCGGIADSQLFDTSQLCCDGKLPYLDLAFCVDKSLATSTGTEKYFPDPGSSIGCIKDTDNCSGSEKCARATDKDRLYDSLQSCCSNAFAWTNPELCISRSSDGVYTERWYVSSTKIGICSKDCEGAASCEVITDMGAQLFGSSSTCCSSLNWVNSALCVEGSEAGAVVVPEVQMEILSAELTSTSDPPPPQPLLQTTSSPSTRKPTPNPTNFPTTAQPVQSVLASVGLKVGIMSQTATDDSPTLVHHEAARFHINDASKEESPIQGAVVAAVLTSSAIYQSINVALHVFGLFVSFYVII